MLNFHFSSKFKKTCSLGWVKEIRYFCISNSNHALYFLCHSKQSYFEKGLVFLDEGDILYTGKEVGTLLLIKFILLFKTFCKKYFKNAPASWDVNKVETRQEVYFNMWKAYFHFVILGICWFVKILTEEALLRCSFKKGIRNI